MKSFLPLVLTFIILASAIPSSVAQAQNLIIFVSDNEADLTIAAKVSELLNAELVVTPWGIYDPNVSAKIIDMDPSLVIIIGGPVAVVDRYSEDFQSFGVSYTRLYGENRVETAMKVIEFIKKDYPDILRGAKFFAVYGWDLGGILRLREIMKEDKSVIPVFVGPNTTNLPVTISGVIVTSNSEKIMGRFKVGNVRVIQAKITRDVALKAIEYAQMAIENAKEVSGDQELLNSAMTLFDLAKKAFSEGDYEKAYALAFASLAKAQKTIVLGNVGKDSTLVMKLKSQLRLMWALVFRLEVKGQDVSQATYYLKLAEKALEEGKIDEAIIYLEKAKDSLKERVKGRMKWEPVRGRGRGRP
ncbi:hypothetical protein TQ32_08470 [Pyrococcus kukulkanii]|uniref:Cell wall-binding repeat 2 family protein n=1 Tax=Pyrococcus kukulkanii TaxID=1609559 RepID=A0A127BCU6_9EURY|nr:hypothetical protein TQ32_08470 [Pyrococcus kukulkanii]